MKTLFVWGILALGPLGIINPAWAQRDSNLMGVNLSMDLFQPRTMNGRDADLRSRLSDHRVGTR